MSRESDVRKMASMVAEDKAAPKTHEHQMSEVQGLIDALAGKAANDHNHDAVYASLVHNHDGVYDQAGAAAEALEAALGADFSGDYVDLTNKPTLGDSAAKNVGTTAGTVAAGDHTHPGGGSGAAWGEVTGTLSDQEDLQTALDGKSASDHNHDSAYEPKNANIQTHVAQAHAPSDAQKNSDITKAEIEAKLTGEISSHSHAGGSDPWTIVALSSDFTTTSSTAGDVTGLAFTPAANTRYMFEAVLGVRTATATVNPRVGLAWPTGMTDGVGQIDEAQSATARLMSNGNVNTALLIAVGGIPNTTQSWPVTVWGWVRAGASPSGNVRIQLATETANTTVRVVAGSYLRYRTY